MRRGSRSGTGPGLRSATATAPAAPLVQNTAVGRLKYAPKVPVALIARLYRQDALGLKDDALLVDASWRHHDLLGGNARPAFAAFVERFPAATTYQERMLLVDRLVHAVHTTGGLAARNLFEGRPRRGLAALDALAGDRP